MSRRDHAPGPRPAGAAGRRPGGQRPADGPRRRAHPLRALRSRAGAAGSCGPPASPSGRSRSSSPPSTAGAEPVALAEVSERDLVAHFTRLSHRQFSVDLGAYPLGSCTMKYNPKVCDTVAALPGLAGVHPAAPAALTQGWLALLVELEAALCEITGMAAATLQPAAGAAGELTGLLLMRAFHAAQRRAAPPGDHPRLGPRHQPGLGHPGGLRGDHRARRRAGLRRHGGPARGARHRRGRDHADQPQHPRACSRRTSQAIAAAVHEVGRAPLLRRGQPQRHLGRGAARATWASTSCT